MNIAQIEINLQKLIATFNKENFIYELLLAYGLPKASITRLKKGNLNLSKLFYNNFPFPPSPTQHKKEIPLQYQGNQENH